MTITTIAHVNTIMTITTIAHVNTIMTIMTIAHVNGNPVCYTTCQTNAPFVRSVGVNVVETLSAGGLAFFNRHGPLDRLGAANLSLAFYRAFAKYSIFFLI